MANSDLIATAALVVAVLAMSATFWQAHVARFYGRISVRPHLDWGINGFVNKPIVLYLLNNGLGPAIIESFILTLDGKRFSVEGMVLPPEIHKEVMSITGFTEWNLFAKGTPIANGTQINLFYFENQSLGVETHNQAIALLNRIGLEIHYSSFYGERFVLRRLVLA